ncbi:hypothetical protein [Cupriavidus metallidurans]|uniref:hypothetical protein n=1 Tax=Cupriavidus metallidurans TaxID=119219 RepID=UPI00031C0249|nr:hypothetical protein [Cupriavidus metallidurans]QGS32556.1 hypothetical protein FOB83_27435 [Cupriavidus metallidurans]
MRKFLASTTRTSALTERLVSPFLRAQTQSNTSTSTTNSTSLGQAGRTDAPRSDREYADAAIRFCRTLW